MNQEIKEQWVDALRSGIYKQSKHKLRSTDDKYCCLGVLCDIHSTTKNGFKWVKKPGFNCYSYNDYEALPTINVILWCNLLNNSKDYLIMMNDSGKSFKQIANYIERNL